MEQLISPFLAESPCLVELSLCANKISSSSAKIIGSLLKDGKIKQLEVLDLSENFLTYDETDEMLILLAKQCKNLQTVNLSYNYLDNVFLNRFDKLLRDSFLDRMKRPVTVKCYGNQFDQEQLAKGKERDFALFSSYSSLSKYSVKLFKENLSKMSMPLSFRFDRIKYNQPSNLQINQKKSQILNNSMSSLEIRTKNLNPVETNYTEENFRNSRLFVTECESFGDSFLFNLKNYKFGEFSEFKYKDYSEFMKCVESYNSLAETYLNLRFCLKKSGDSVQSHSKIHQRFQSFRH